MFKSVRGLQLKVGDTIKDGHTDNLLTIVSFRPYPNSHKVGLEWGARFATWGDRRECTVPNDGWYQRLEQ